MTKRTHANKDHHFLILYLFQCIILLILMRLYVGLAIAGMCLGQTALQTLDTACPCV